MSLVTMHVDVEQTRRKRFVHILDARSEVMWSGQKVSEGLKWLDDQGVSAFRMEGPDRAFLISFQREQQ